MTKYYYLKDRGMCGRSEDGKYYLLNGTRWEEDKDSEIRDRLMGYDPYEPPGSPYGFGSLSVMDSIEEISEEELRKHLEDVGLTESLTGIIRCSYDLEEEKEKALRQKYGLEK
ncbi:MAG: hypothetical protein IKE21_02395 [Erysipelotrichaceae bacterium]|nr:hypothetical protein [Erysipelotrichaceae bacterium]